MTPVELPYLAPPPHSGDPITAAFEEFDPGYTGQDTSTYVDDPTDNEMRLVIEVADTSATASDLTFTLIDVEASSATTTLGLMATSDGPGRFYVTEAELGMALEVIANGSDYDQITVSAFVQTSSSSSTTTVELMTPVELPYLLHNGSTV